MVFVYAVYMIRIVYGLTWIMSHFHFYVGFPSMDISAGGCELMCRSELNQELKSY